MSKRIALIAAVVTAVVAGLAVSAATASPKKHARQDDRATCSSASTTRPNTLYGDPDDGVRDADGAQDAGAARQPLLGRNKWAVANKQPTDATDPGDPAYNWALYDRLVKYATHEQHQGRLLDPLHARRGRTAARPRPSRRRTPRSSRTSRTPLPSATAATGSRRRGSRIASTRHRQHCRCRR